MKKTNEKANLVNVANNLIDEILQANPEKDLTEYINIIDDDNSKMADIKKVISALDEMTEPEKIENEPEKIKNVKFQWLKKENLKKQNLEFLIFENIKINDIFAFRVDEKVQSRKKDIDFSDLVIDENGLTWYKVTSIKDDKITLTSTEKRTDGKNNKWILWADNFNGKKSVDDCGIAFTKYIECKPSKATATA